MSTRTCLSGFVALAGIMLLFAGCQQDGSDQPAGGTASGQTGPAQVNLPLIPGATLEVVKSTLGTDFVAKSGGPRLCLVKTVGPHDVMVFVQHDAAGGVNNVQAHVVGPQASADATDELYRQTGLALAKSLAIQDLDEFASHAEIGLIKTRAGFPHSFRLGRLYFAMAPDIPLRENSPQIPFKPNYVQRDFAASPKIGEDPALKAIPGVSLTQLEELLDGFTPTIKAGKDQILFARELDTHTDFVHCQSNERGELIRLEVFVGRVKGDANLAALTEQLWIKLAGLPYRNCDPEKAIAFIKGPKLDYAAGDGRNINGVAFYLPLNVDGKRKLMSIYEEK